jgi:caffeoyl-CoA O-methyltransferase
MSIRPTPVTDDIFKYLFENFSSEDEFLKRLKLEAIEAGMPEICISPEEGRILQFLLRTIHAKYVLEIGSLGGYSAIIMAKALPADGKLIAIELNSFNVQFMKKKCIEAGLEKKIEIQNANARKFLKDFKPDFLFDFVFIDSDKENYIHYFDTVTPLLRTGGIVAADNAFAFGEIGSQYENTSDYGVRHLRRYNEYIKNHKGYFSAIIPAGDGLAVSIKL